MTAPRPALLAAVLSISLSACDRGGEPVASSGAGNLLLDYAPADTPFLAANLEPLPEDVVDAYLERLQPVFDEMQTQLTVLRDDLEARPPGTPGTADADPGARLALAVARELDGKLSRSGLSSLGLDILSPKVAYGLGAFPVFRLGLSDPEALRASIRRILSDAGVPTPEQEYQGVPYWKVIAEEDPQDSPVGLYVAIVDGHLAAGLLPQLAEAELLPAFLGVAKPAATDARARLAELNRAQGYTPYGSGILDLHRLADQFLQPDTVTARVMAASGEFDPASISAECVSEVHSIIDSAPRITAGTVRLDTSSIAYQYRVESPATLAGQLAGLVARLPVADAGSQRMLDLSFGMRFGAVRDFLREKAIAITEDPYLCEHLQDLNSSAEQSLTRLDQPMPPFVNNFRGLRISLSEMMLNHEFIPADARGHLALHVEQPEMFVGMAQMFLPDLSELALIPGAEPVQLPAALIPVPDLVAFAAMSKEAIGLSVGAGEETSLEEFLTREPGPEGMFLSASYDTAAYLEYTDRFARHADGGNGGAGDSPDAVHAIGTAARSAFHDMADRSYTTLRFGPAGLVIDGHMTFKP